MIISATRVRAASGARPLADHVLRGEGNLLVATLRGSEADLADMVATARHAGARYAVRHWHVSPGEPMPDEEALAVVDDLAAEFGFEPLAAVVVRHEKGRRTEHNPITGAQGAPMHWHVMVPEVDPVTLRCLDCRWMRPRHERIARGAELRLGHRVTKGRFNTSVLRTLEARGDARSAALLEEAGIADGRPAYAAYTGDQRRALERVHAAPRGGGPLDLPSLVRGLQDTWAAYRDDPEALATALRRVGLRVRRARENPPEIPGRAVLPAPSTRTAAGWVVDAYDGASREAYVLGALHTLVRERRRAVERRLEQSAKPTNGVGGAVGRVTTDTAREAAPQHTALPSWPARMETPAVRGVQGKGIRPPQRGTAPGR